MTVTTKLTSCLAEFHLGIASQQPSSEVSAELIQNKWCAVFGGPEVLQTDAGPEFEDVMRRMTRLLDCRREVVPPGAKWRQGQVERHGAVVKLMMMRVIASQQAAGLDDMKLVATACFTAKNRMANRSGLSPMQAVTGKNTTIPASIMEQITSGKLRQVLNEQLDTRDALRRAERIRAAAVDSFNWIDSNEVIREAFHKRSRPPRLDCIQEGTTVYVHQPPPARRGQHRRLQDHSSWDGPGIVVLLEKQTNTAARIWVRLRSKVRSFPPEKVRLATPDEMVGSQFVLEVLEELHEQMRRGELQAERRRGDDGNGDVGMPEEPTTAAAPRTRRRRSDLAQVQEVSSDDAPMDEAHQAEDRASQVRRLEMLNDVPESIRRSLSSSSSSVALARNLDVADRQELLAEDDDMTEPAEEGAEAEHMEGPEPSTLAFGQKKQLFEDLAKQRKGMPSKLTEAQLRSGLAQASHQGEEHQEADEEIAGGCATQTETVARRQSRRFVPGELCGRWAARSR